MNAMSRLGFGVGTRGLQRHERLPPFGKARQTLGPGLVFIVPSTGSGWQMTRRYSLGEVLVMQLGHDPATYAWPVKDCQIGLYTECLDDRTIDRMVQVLYQSGAGVVYCYNYRWSTRAPA